MKKQESIKLNMVMHFILTISNTVFPLITYSYVARVLSPRGTGQVAFVDSVVAYFLLLATSGIPSYGKREVAKNRDNREQFLHFVQELFIINICTTIVAYCALWLTVLFVPKLHGYSMLFFIMGAQVVLKCFGMEWLYAGIEKYTYITIRTLIFKTISVVLTFILIHGPSDILWYGVIHVFTSSASYICNFFNLRKYISFRKKSRYKLKKHIKPIFVLFSASLAITIYSNMDISMLGFFSTEFEVGLYSAAAKIKVLIITLSATVAAVLSSRMAYCFEKKEYTRIVGLLQKSLRISLLTTLPLGTYVFVFSRNVLEFVGGTDYISAEYTLKVLMLCVLALIATNLCGEQLLIPMGREKQYAQSVLIGLFINLGLNYTLIPIMGALGAAIGTLTTEIWNVFWMGRCSFDFLGKIIKQFSFWKYFIPVTLAGVIAFYVERKLGDMMISLKLVITALPFFGIYYAIMIFLKEPIVCDILRGIKFWLNAAKKDKQL